ncbi:checkpoint protein Hus1/Mec3 [Morchella snyderi]|nr:checkpoint protein Hus1/Mec3 [Morchella snyderi]
MRFKTDITNITTLTKLVSCLSSISKVAWLKLDEEQVHFTLMDEDTVKVFATISKETIFSTYRIASASSNTINLEVPLPVLLRALRSCASSPTATIRLTKRAADNVPILCITVSTAPASSTLVTQEIPVRVLAPATVAGLGEPEVPPPQVSVVLPALAAVRGVVERMNRLAVGRVRVRLGARRVGAEREFRMGVEGDEVKVESVWKGLGSGLGVEEEEEIVEPEEDGDGWAGVTVNGKEWARVLKCAGLAKNVVAFFVNDYALVVYVYLAENENDAVITYYMSSLSD